MTISIYQASVPGILRMLGALSALLDKAGAYCVARKMDEAALLNARLYPDMFPLARQIQIASDTAKGVAARLAGQDPPSFPDNETSISDLKARIAKTVDFVKSLDQAKFEGAESRQITIPVGGGRKIEAKGLDYLTMNALPNFYFHATTAYDILRHAGLEIGKPDFLAGGPSPRSA